VPGGAIGGIIASAAVGDGRVFFSTAVGNSLSMLQLPAAWGLNAVDGAVLWANPNALPSFGPTSALPGVALMGELGTGMLNAYAADSGDKLAALDTMGIPGGVAAAAAVVDGMIFIGGGTGARGSRPDDQGQQASNFDTPLSAFCVAGAPGCAAEPPCDDGNACTYDFRRAGACMAEPAPDTLDCLIGGSRGLCTNGACGSVP
jgi:hypothetical protein